MKNINIYKVNDDYIIAENQEQAVKCHMDAVGPNWYRDEEPDVEVIPNDTEGRFEREDGLGFEEMTFGEWLKDFEYTEPQIICWNE